MAVQQFPVIIKVISNSEDIAVKVLNFSGVRPFDMWRRMASKFSPLWFPI